MNYNKCLFQLLSIFVVHTSCTKFSENDTLVMVNILFRHGDRTVEEVSFYPNDPYLKEQFYPYGVGQLTNEGKRRMYSLGKEMRKRYKNFLDDTYMTDLIYARSSEYDRTKASLMLFLSGLFPPTKLLRWNDDLNWNPIPFRYVERMNDKDFLTYFQPEFRQLLKEYQTSDEYKAKIQNDTHLMKYVEKHSGRPIRTIFDLTIIATCLISEEELKLTLPAWTKSIYPYPMKHYQLAGYLEATATKEMVKLCGGYMLQTILKDTADKLEGKLPNQRKMHIHSGHDLNIFCILKLLGTLDPHIPPYGAHLILEVHKNNNSYGLKIYYNNKIQNIPNCGTFCKLEDFMNLYKTYLPK